MNRSFMKYRDTFFTFWMPHPGSLEQTQRQLSGFTQVAFRRAEHCICRDVFMDLFPAPHGTTQVVVRLNRPHESPRDFVEAKIKMPIQGVKSVPLKLRNYIAVVPDLCPSRGWVVVKQFKAPWAARARNYLHQVDADTRKRVSALSDREPDPISYLREVFGFSNVKACGIYRTIHTVLETVEHLLASHSGSVKRHQHAVSFSLEWDE
jgi:hypothetical protein